MRIYKSVKKRFLEDPEFRKEYEALGPNFALIESIIRRRMELKMSQEDLAAKVGTGQAVISRLESGNANPTLASLAEIAKALDADLRIELKPKGNSKVATLAEET
ncbi:MAG: helix-turn-helix transcriptional regulator [Chloroflexi bacterium]|nr:helix-turn-helix transcriptional regulator [Chloroflexota bacterium]MBL7061244.1 helix-turn-helix transcriptional regulator [Dehalococcoidia bacterium]